MTPSSLLTMYSKEQQTTSVFKDLLKKLTPQPLKKFFYANILEDSNIGSSCRLPWAWVGSVLDTILICFVLKIRISIPVHKSGKRKKNTYNKEQDTTKSVFKNFLKKLTAQRQENNFIRQSPKDLYFGSSCDLFWR